MWLPGSLPGDLKSHEKKRLSDHLQNVAETAKHLAQAHGIDVDEKALEAIGWTHDLGKVHPKFQAYLDGAPQGINHSLPSSYFTLSMTKDILAAEAVRRHHSGLQDVNQVRNFWTSDRQDFQVINNEMKKLVPNWPMQFTQEGWYDFVDFLNLDWEVSAKDWLRLRALYSLFIAADRMDAVGVQKVAFSNLPEFHLPNFPKDGEMNIWRTKVRKMCLGNLPDKILPGVYTLTLPTGAGKTVTGLQIAKEMATRTGATSIIYALPFIAIVEQNAKVAREVFQAHVQEDHSGVGSADEESNELSQNPWGRMSSYFRYWTEPVVVTTLVAFWRALFEARANATMNFHRLSGAVVILDEPQSISPELWEGFGKTMAYLAEHWGTTFLLMTATQPLIGQGRELAQGIEPFPKSRHTYEFLDQKFELQQLPQVLREHLPFCEGSGMMVLNTKKSAYELWDLLQNPKKDGHLEGSVLFLSRSMAPIHRRRILTALKGLQRRGRKHYLVATQVVEAGVDLSFDWVYRDVGPLDSIIQAAGRCNRHFDHTKPPGSVLVAELVNTQGRAFHSFVYSQILTNGAKEVLSKYKAFTEQEVSVLIDEYYRVIMDGLRPKDCFELINNGEWGSIPPLIETKYYGEVQVFVELDQGLIQILKQLESTEWTFENQERIRQLWRRASQYMIEVPFKSLLKSREIAATISTTSAEPPVRAILNGEYWLISKDALGTIYHPLAGYIPPDLGEEDVGNVIF